MMNAYVKNIFLIHSHTSLIFYIMTKNENSSAPKESGVAFGIYFYLSCEKDESFDMRLYFSDQNV